MLLSGEILQANDELSHIINSYKTIVEGHSNSGDTEAAQGGQTSIKQGEVWISRCFRGVYCPDVQLHASNCNDVIFKNMFYEEKLHVSVINYSVACKKHS